ncbi:MAG: septation protein A [Rhodovibrionaceae bacterium]
MTPEDAKQAPWVRIGADYGPLLIFFGVYFASDILTATAALVAASLVALAVSWFAAKRVPWLPLLAAVILSIFGGLTLVFEDDLFIKIKPTIVQLLFAAALLGGLAIGKVWLKLIMGRAVTLPDRAWRTLTIRFAVFFVVMAAANEVVWRGFSTDFWVTFDTFGQMGITLAFVASQFPFIARNHIEDEENAPDQ